MLSICSSVFADDARCEGSLRSLWALPVSFEHVVVLNRCSKDFEARVRSLEPPPHVTVKFHTDGVQVAKPGLESLLTPPDNEHSPAQFRARCNALCEGFWIMHTNASFVATPKWLDWFSNLHLDKITDPCVVVSMYARTPAGLLMKLPMMFNFKPDYHRHYWWEIPIKKKSVQCIESLPSDAFEGEWGHLPVNSRTPWFADREPLLESTFAYAQTLLPPPNNYKQFVSEVSKLFDPEGTFRDSNHDRWTELGAAALRALSGWSDDVWRNAPQFRDSIDQDQAHAYWSQIYAMEFEVGDLQPICSECDEGIEAVETWPDGLKASATTLKHLWHALFVLDHFHDVNRVVEVGAGYGAFAKAFLLAAKLCNRTVSSYTIVETPAMQLLCAHYLWDVRPNLEFLNPRLRGSDMPEASLLVSIDGISEFSSRERDQYLKHTLPRAKHVFMRWGCTEFPPELEKLRSVPDWCSATSTHNLLFA